jgi:hypothetical protein
MANAAAQVEAPPPGAAVTAAQPRYASLRCDERRVGARSRHQGSRYIGSLSCKLSGMKHEQSQSRRPWLAAAQFLCPAGALLIMLLLPVAAQDIRGMELCTVETRMERRTGCLQANVEWLQQALIKLARETQDKITATDRDLAAARAEIAALKSTMEKLNSELMQMKANAESSGKK